MATESVAAAQDTPHAGAANNPSILSSSAAPEATSAAASEAKTEVANPEPTTQPSESKPAVPQAYALKLPEGSPLEAAQLEKIASYAKEQGLSEEQAQKLVERESAAVSGFVESQKEIVKKQVDAWMADTKSDKEIGGDAFNQNVELAKRVVQKYGSPSLQQALNETGLGNHPELVRFCLRIGKSMADDQLVLPGAQSGGRKSAEEIFYGSDTNPKE